MEREEVRFASGGELCAATLFRPATAERHRLPCVVMGSGISCVRDQKLGEAAARIAAAGFAALAFDYRYFGDSEGEPRSLVKLSDQRADWRAAIAFAASLDSVDPSRIALWGFSLSGGHVQALAATELQIAAAICVAPLVDAASTLMYVGGMAHPLRLMAAGLRDAWRGLRGADPHRIPVAGPPGSLAVLNSPGSLPGFEAITPAGSTWRNELCPRGILGLPYRPGRKTARIACPILYCIAEDDDVNPPALGRKAAKRAPRGELRLYPGGHFDPLLGNVLEQMTGDQVDFLHRHLGGG